MTFTPVLPKEFPTTRASYAYEGPLKKALAIADHYGFTVIPPLRIEKEDREHARKHGCPEHHAAVVRMAGLDERYRMDETLLWAYTYKIPYKNKLALRLDVIGDRESSAEGLLLKVVHAILREYGYKDTLLKIGSVGVRESFTSYTHAVQSFVRSHLADLNPDCREKVRENIFAPLSCRHDACILARDSAPQTLNFLSEQSKQHLKEVLEYLESFNMPYIVDPYLTGENEYTTKTVFRIGVPPVGAEEGDSTFSHTLAWGERYDQLSKKAGAKKTIPAIHASIDLSPRGSRERYTLLQKTSLPAAYVVQVGLPAKIQALLMHEMLRKTHIKVRVNLYKNSVSEQMDHARALGFPTLVIIGHKEVHDGTALVRHLLTNRQDTVPVRELPRYLKMTVTRRGRRTA
ncbi:MAG: His/Gly/Thr/Pro-type tRNA ligase C-terminal domain-containing protein [Patescibacteria group bacterium]